MHTNPATQVTPAAVHAAAFEFVQALAAELSSGKIDLPSFPEVAVRVRRALSDERTTVEQVVRIVGAEPTLAARLLNMANSAALNRSGKPVTDLRTAIARIGYDMVRSAAIAFAIAQLRSSAHVQGMEQPLAALWQHSTNVAACCYVLARNQTHRNPDEALLAGLLHGVGRLYILSRASRHGTLFADRDAFEQVMRDWHAAIGKAILENWEMGEELVAAVAEQDDVSRTHRGAVDLTDVLVCGNLMATFFEQPADLELNMQGVSAFRMLGLDAGSCARLMTECRDEVAALRQALGD